MKSLHLIHALNRASFTDFTDSTEYIAQKLSVSTERNGW